jgi:GH43 family beta-xylosidase
MFTRLFFTAFSCFCFLNGSIRAFADSGKISTFTNPVVERGADPWVIRYQTNYYLCQSYSNAVWINRAARLEDIGKDNWIQAWRPVAGTSYSKEVWAPELRLLRGKWYIYVAADDGNNSHHRMYVLEHESTNPQGDYVLKGKIAAPTDRWAIDGTVLEMPDKKLYFIWSGWDGTNDVAQNLYIAPMSNPWTISGERVCISRPEFDWEQREHPRINEGPETLWHNGELFIVYSASGSWAENYCLGQLKWNGGDVLNPHSWAKKPEPVFSGTENVFSPGHCSFVKSPDGKEDWIVYHAQVSQGSGWNRNVRIQPFTWNADGSPNFGNPVPPNRPLPVPSGE